MYKPGMPTRASLPSWLHSLTGWAPVSASILNLTGLFIYCCSQSCVYAMLSRLRFIISVHHVTNNPFEFIHDPSQSRSFSMLISFTSARVLPTGAVCNFLHSSHGLSPFLALVHSVLSSIFQQNCLYSVFEPGRDFATLSRFLFECRTKINHPRHHVATKYEMSRV